MFYPRFFRLPRVRKFNRTSMWSAVLMVLLSLAWADGGLAQMTTNPSGLPLPRFVSLRSEPINVRVGPGTRYEVAWVFVQADLPVEVIQEFDTWRKIRDLDGQEGWIHQNLLVGKRTAYVAPWAGEQPIALRSDRAPDANVRAWLGAKLLINVDSCDGVWCRVATKAGNGQPSVNGYVDQEQLWGVYSGETFD